MTSCPHFNGPSPCDVIYIVIQLFVHVSSDGLLETCDAHMYGYLVIYWCCSESEGEREGGREGEREGRRKGGSLLMIVCIL